MCKIKNVYANVFIGEKTVPLSRFVSSFFLFLSVNSPTTLTPNP